MLRPPEGKGPHETNNNYPAEHSDSSDDERSNFLLGVGGSSHHRHRQILRTTTTSSSDVNCNLTSPQQRDASSKKRRPAAVGSSSSSSFSSTHNNSTSVPPRFPDPHPRLLKPCVDDGPSDDPGSWNISSSSRNNNNNHPMEQDLSSNYSSTTTTTATATNTRTNSSSSKSSQGVQTEVTAFTAGRCNRHRGIVTTSRAMDNVQCNNNNNNGGGGLTEQKYDSVETTSTGRVSRSSSMRDNVHKSPFRQIRGLSTAALSKWRKHNRKPRQVMELTQEYLGGLYRPFSSVRRQLTQQANEVLQQKYQGDDEAFENQFLRPITGFLRFIHDSGDAVPRSYRQQYRRRRKKSGWPLCVRNCVIVHLSELDSRLLSDGDFYFLVDVHQGIILIYKTEGRLYQRALDAKMFCSLMSGMLSADDENSPGDDEEEEEEEEEGNKDDDEDVNNVEKDLSRILAHFLVSLERGIQRIELRQVARDLWKWDAAGSEGGKRPERKHRSTRDSWVQTDDDDDARTRNKYPSDPSNSSATCNDGISMAPLASEEEFCSDSEMKLKQSGQCRRMPDRVVPVAHSSSDLMEEGLCGGKLLKEPATLSDLSDELLQSKIAILPGCRDLCGRSVVYLSLEQLTQHPSATPYQVAQLILYFTKIPKRDVMRLGFQFIVDGQTATDRECDFLEKTLSLVEAYAPRTVSVLLILQKQHQKPVVQPTSPLHRKHIRIENIVNVNQLLKYIRRNQLLPQFGGNYVYDHDEWLNFCKLLDPFTSGCRETGHHLLSVMQELRSHQLPSSSSLSCQMIEHHKKQIMDALEDQQLRHLETEGDSLLKELESYQRRHPQNHDYRESVERCSLLYKQLRKILQKLTKLANKRLGRLQECMMLRSFEEESSQILSWLCHKGEETLKWHKSMSDNFSAIKDQVNEFEKFYFLAMRQIERGNDLLDEAPKPKIVSVAGINGLTCILKSQLEEFTDRLEEARERLEDTSRCYNLLDKSYEWALDTMRFIAQMKVDTSTSLEETSKVLKQLEEHLSDHCPINEDRFDELFSLAKKLKNKQLLEQCNVAKNKCHETVDLLQARVATLRRAKQQMDQRAASNLNSNSRNVHMPKFFSWMPVISSTPYRCTPNVYLHGNSPIYGSQQIYREPTGSYTSFPSSYYPAVGLKNGAAGGQRNSLSKVLPTFSNSNSRDQLTARPESSVSFNPAARKSYPCSTNPTASSNLKTSSSASGGSKETLDDSESAASSVQSILQLKELSPEHSWKICEEALNKAADEVRQQNMLMEEQRQLVETENYQDDIDNTIDDEDVDDVDCIQNKKPVKPAPVNMHLLRCASCSDFEELLSSKNAELEAEKKSKRILMLIMREMIQTERDYVASLEYIIENYIPLLQTSDIPQSLRGQRNVLFGNIEKIYEFHKCYFLQELEMCESSPYSVGQCFLKYEPQFYLYALYNKNKPKSDELMSEYGNNFFKAKQQELGDKMDLASYLLKPVQRMGKYALLLKQLLKECPSTDSDYSDLKAAEEMVHFQLRHGNDLLAMDALRECDVNVKEQGRLLRQDEFLVWQGKSRKALRHIFLFEDLILFSKARRDPICKNHEYFQYKCSIKTTDIGLTEQVGESPTKFEIWFRKRKAQDTYTIQAPSAEIKNAWVQDISKLLWKQALRNRELRLAEMSSMGIGNKPCLDIGPNQDQICDRSISIQQLNKAPRFRNSIAVTGCDNYTSARPQSMASVASSSSSCSSSSGPLCIPATLIESDEKENRRLSLADRSQCSAESGIFTDASMSGDSYVENDLRQKDIEHTDVLPEKSPITSSCVSKISDSVQKSQDSCTPMVYCGETA